MSAVFMSDDAEQYCNAWTMIFGGCFVLKACCLQSLHPDVLVLLSENDSAVTMDTG